MFIPYTPWGYMSNKPKLSNFISNNDLNRFWQFSNLLFSISIKMGHVKN